MCMNSVCLSTREYYWMEYVKRGTTLQVFNALCGHHKENRRKCGQLELKDSAVMTFRVTAYLGVTKVSISCCCWLNNAMGIVRLFRKK